MQKKWAITSTSNKTSNANYHFFYIIMLAMSFGLEQQEIHSITLLVLCDQVHRHVEHILECRKCYTFRVYVLHISKHRLVA
jgi:hypothetical protein